MNTKSYFKIHKGLMGPLCNLNEFKNTDNRLVKINKTNLINNFRSPDQCQKKEKESAEGD